MEQGIWTRISKVRGLVQSHKERGKDETENVLSEIRSLNELIPTELNCEFKDLFEDNPSECKERQDEIAGLFEDLFTYAAVPAFHGREDCGFDSSDFCGVAEQSYCSANAMIHLLNPISNAQKNIKYNRLKNKPQFCKKIVLYSLALVGQHTSDDPWSTDQNFEIANTLMQVCLKFTSCKTMQELLCSPPAESIIGEGFLKYILTWMKPKLTKDIWKQNPSIPRTFTWVVTYVKSPYLSEQIQMVLPPSLLFVDDHQPEYKLLGITCLHHLMKECSREEIRWYGRGEVIYDALQHQLYLNDPEVLDAVFPALFLILEILIGLPRNTGPPRLETRYDAVLHRILQSMELETKLVLRRIYTKHLPKILSSMGITICRHLISLFQMMTSYIEIYDGPSEEARLGALDILYIVIQEAWPRMNNHTESILKMLLKLVYGLSSDKTITPPDVKEALLCKALNCAKLLRTVNKEMVDSMLVGVTKIDFNDGCAKFALEAIKETT